ncbi:MAG: hypothetical protein IJA67_03425 [Oscillospiraceae bacterium]|nr:hypothetical protein [Oscillospiraceae bacterium]
MKPMFKIILANNAEHDYSAFVESLSPTLNDLDADGSGRNVLDGMMYRSRIASKDSLQVKFLPLPELIMKSLAEDVMSEYVTVKVLDPLTNTHVNRTYYISTRNWGDQKYNKGKGVTEYIGCNFKLTER